MGAVEEPGGLSVRRPIARHSSPDLGLEHERVVRRRVVRCISLPHRLRAKENIPELGRYLDWAGADHRPVLQYEFGSPLAISLVEPADFIALHRANAPLRAGVN